MMQYLKKAKERTAEDHRKLRQTVSEIIENVCESGDRALHEYSRRFDASDRASFRVSRDEIEAAYAKMTEQELAASGFRPETIRLSIGSHHIEDIIQDLDQPFECVVSQ